MAFFLCSQLSSFDNRMNPDVKAMPVNEDKHIDLCSRDRRAAARRHGVKRAESRDLATKTIKYEILFLHICARFRYKCYIGQVYHICSMKGCSRIKYETQRQYFPTRQGERDSKANRCERYSEAVSLHFIITNGICGEMRAAFSYGAGICTLSRDDF